MLPMSGVGRYLARVAVGAAGTAVGLRLGARTRRRIGPLEVQAEVGLAAAGGTDVEIPPLGAAHLATHRGPLRLRAEVAGVDVAAVGDLLSDEKQSSNASKDSTDSTDSAKALLVTAGKAAQADGSTLLRELGRRSAVAGLGGAATLAALIFRRPRDVAAVSVLSAAGLAGAVARTAATFDRDAWRDPQLSGLLTRAPSVVGDLRSAPQRIGTYRDQLAELVRTATDVYLRVADLPEAPPDDAIRLVHVSDVHLSPLGLPLAKVLVDRYRADAVVDTGDLVDWGTPAEDAFADQIAALRVPYLYVKGNHDSAHTVRAVARQPNATVLGDEPVEIVGLRFVGMPDPRYTPDKTTGDDHAAHRIGEAAAEFADRIRDAHADVALVHAPAAGRKLAGLVPLVLAGDIHRRDVRVFGGTTVLVQGTSGGSGLRGVQHDPPTPLDFSVLYVDRATKQLWGADEVTLDGLGATSVTVRRRTAAELRAST